MTKIKKFEKLEKTQQSVNSVEKTDENFYAEFLKSFTTKDIFFEKAGES